jgi:hypothetical protein
MSIEERIRDSEKAPEPGTWGEKIDGEEFPMTATELKSAGYVYIYDTKTGERSLCNNNMLAQHLRKKRTDGSYVFTTQKPRVTPQRGTLKCMLHPDDPNRTHYDDLGLPTCRKSNLTSPFQVTRHMQKRHKMEWASIEKERQDAEKQEERAFREYLMTRDAGDGEVETPTETPRRGRKAK